jgi:hypothetical protein
MPGPMMRAVATAMLVVILHYTQPNQDWREAEILLEHVGTGH